MEAVILEMVEQMRMVWLVRGASELPSSGGRNSGDHNEKQAV